MEIVDTVKVTRNGDSLYARIPANIAKVLGISKGDELTVSKDNARIVYERK